jgi:DNA-binding MarR family transcriptional regulator
MVQATEERLGERTLVALWDVLRRLKARSAAESADAAALHVVHMVHAHGPLRLTDLAARASLDVSTVSRHVRALEAAGQLARTGDPEDRRATRIALTDDGEALLRAALTARGRWLDEAVAGWAPEDRVALATLLTRLAEDLQ